MNSNMVEAATMDEPVPVTTCVLAGLPPLGRLGASVVADTRATIGTGTTVDELVAVAIRTNQAVCAARAEWEAAANRDRLDGAQADREAKVARHKLVTVIQDVVFQIRQSAAELRYLDEVEMITHAQQKLLRNQTTGGGAAGVADRSGLPEAREKAGQIDDDTVLVTEAKGRELARLNALLNRSPETPVGTITVDAKASLACDGAEIDGLVEDVGIDHSTAREFLSRLKEAERLAIQYRDDLIPSAERAVETAQTRLSTGLGSIREYLEALSARYERCLAGARADADRSVSLARLEALSRHGMTTATAGTHGQGLGRSSLRQRRKS